MVSPLVFYLCIDCGGSKTSAALASSSGEIVGRGRSGPSNFSYVGYEIFLSAIGRATADALANALGLLSPEEASKGPPVVLPLDPITSLDALGRPLPQHTIRAAWLGISGVDSLAAIARLTPLVATFFHIPPERVSITNDALLLGSPLRALPNVRSAVGAIAGTGSVLVSLREGPDPGEALIELARAGGWGWILGDEGGGFDVGRTALRTVRLSRSCPDRLRRTHARRARRGRRRRGGTGRAAVARR